MIEIKFIPCSPDFRNDCASEQEMRVFHKSHELLMFSHINYIEMEEIESIEDSIKKSFHVPLLLVHSMDEPKMYEITLDEYRASFQDSQVNFMGLEKPKEFEYLNFSDSHRVKSNNYDRATWIIISLSKKVIHQKRNVYNIFMMFGDVGGLNDFLCLLISPVFGLFSDYLLNGDMV